MYYPLSVDGHWTGWLQWSGCTDIGESGQMTRERLCLNPRPSNGGNDCAGPITEQMECELSSGVGEFLY